MFPNGGWSQQSFSSHSPGGYTGSAFNISGWKTQLYGETFPREEMSDWLDNGIRHVRRLPNRHVLETGCGTGWYCIGWRLLPIPIALRIFLKPPLICSTIRSSRIKTYSMSRWTSKRRIIPCCISPTMIWLFSTRYSVFSNHAYLEKVLRLIGDTIAENGQAFIGDIRSESLLKAFHTSVELSRMPGDTSESLLKAAVDRGIFMDYELCVNPAFFMNLRAVHPRMTGVEILYKQSRYDNEMRRYRYDVVIYFDHIPDSWPCDRELVWGSKAPLNWRKWYLLRCITASGFPCSQTRTFCLNYININSFCMTPTRTGSFTISSAAAAACAAAGGLSKEQWRKMANTIGIIWNACGLPRYGFVLRSCFIRSCKVPN